MNSISSLDNTNEKKGFSSYYTRTYCKCIHPFLDAGGSASSVCNGLSYLFLLGMMFGLIMPKNQDLPTPWYRYTSSIVGYAYFIFWCVSFYPQIISNYERKSTEGLSADFSVINFIGYFCYAIYTCALYWNEGIKELYRDRHKSEFGDAKITVQSNDVAFALHAVLFAGVWQFQLFVYGGMNFRQGVNPMSKTSMIIILLIILSISFYAMMICKGFGIVRDDSMNGSTSTRGMLPRWIVVYLNWLDFIYFLSFVKVFITFYKYIPQVILNAR
jgi:cystinosin